MYSASIAPYLQHLRPVWKWGLAYLFISPDLRVVRALSHKVIVMRAGDVVEAVIHLLDSTRRGAS